MNRIFKALIIIYTWCGLNVILVRCDQSISKLIEMHFSKNEYAFSLIFYLVFKWKHATILLYYSKNDNIYLLHMKYLHAIYFARRYNIFDITFVKCKMPIWRIFVSVSGKNSTQKDNAVIYRNKSSRIMPWCWCVVYARSACSLYITIKIEYWLRACT